MHYFVLLLRDSVSLLRFPFLALSRWSHLQSSQFFFGNIHTVSFLSSHFCLPDFVVLVFVLILTCPVSCGCRIHQLHLYRGVRPPPHKEYPGYDNKQSDGEVPIMVELWRMQSTSSLSSVQGPLWPGVVAPDRVLSMGQIELVYILIVNWIAWNRTVLKFKLCTYNKLNCLK